MGSNFVWCDSLPSAQAEWGGQAGDEKTMRMGETGLGPEPWLSVGVSEGRIGKKKQQDRHGAKCREPSQLQVWYDGGFSPEMDELTVLPL